jgi:predicted flap endonuclease-1-like 5' DNA nuclease
VPTDKYSLPISKLRGVPHQLRVALKSRKITNCGQLLEAAGDALKRERLGRILALDPELLQRTVQRADLARIDGVGAVFGMMLEDLGIMDVADVSQQDPRELHRVLDHYNKSERLARRSPTPEEVEYWVDQAKQLKILVTY